jgi:hypothetical protein
MVAKSSESSATPPARRRRVRTSGDDATKGSVGDDVKDVLFDDSEAEAAPKRKKATRRKQTSRSLLSRPSIRGRQTLNRDNARAGQLLRNRILRTQKDERLHRKPLLHMNRLRIVPTGIVRNARTVESRKERHRIQTMMAALAAAAAAAADPRPVVIPGSTTTVAGSTTTVAVTTTAITAPTVITASVQAISGEVADGEVEVAETTAT